MFIDLCNCLIYFEWEKSHVFHSVENILNFLFLFSSEDQREPEKDKTADVTTNGNTPEK